MIAYYNNPEKTELLWIGAVYKAQDGNIYKWEITEDELLQLGKGNIAQKKKECRQTILSKYSETDQINIIRKWNQNEIDIMNNFIDSVLQEYRTNLKDADFSSFL